MQLVRRFRAIDLGKHLTRTCVLTVTQKGHAEALPPPAMPPCGHPQARQSKAGMDLILVGLRQHVRNIVKPQG